MRRVDRELKKADEIKEVLDAGKIIQIAFIDKNEPYIVTLNYGYCIENEKYKFYFHSANEGRKIECIKINPNVCFTIAICDPFIEGENACNYGMRYRSIVGYGKLRIVENEEERILGLNILMKQYTGRENWSYDNEVLKRTTISCLEADKITGKRKK